MIAFAFAGILISSRWVLSASHCFMSDGNTPKWQNIFPAGIYARIGAQNVPATGPSSACAGQSPPEEILIKRVSVSFCSPLSEQLSPDAREAAKGASVGARFLC